MIYVFGEFELDEALLELRFRGVAQLVPPRVLKTMLHLLRNRTRAVSRDELVQVVWAGLAVSDAALSQTIMLARKATHDEGDHQTVIKTVRGHGFRFVAQVTEQARPADIKAESAPASADEPEPLFGRDRELDELMLRLERAERGQGSLVLLQGAPGIGKTSFSERFCACAAARNAHVFWGRCWEEGGAPAFWPFIQVLRAIQARCGREALRSWLDDGCRELFPLVPELAPSTQPIADANHLEFDTTQARFRVFDAMARLLARMARALHGESASTTARGVAKTGPAVVIALDDLHAADDASIQLLRFLSPDLRAVPLLVLGTFRDLEVTQHSALSSLLGGPLENTHRLELGGLERQDVARLVSARLGRAAPERTVALLLELSSGNPFLVGEFSRFSQQELELSGLAVLRVPDRMARAVRRRLEGMSAATSEVLELAAVLGREFTLAQAGTVLAWSDDELLSAVEPALRAGTLEVVPSSAGTRMRFPHALVRDTLYGELTLARRHSLHRKIAEALEASHAPDQLPFYELAHHFYLAAPGGCAAKAAEYALKAAAHAERMLAFDSAGSLRDRAIELSTPPRESEVVFCDLLLAAGNTWFLAGELDKAAARYARAAERARDRHDAQRFAFAVLCSVRVRRGFTLFDARLIALIHQALDALALGDNMLRAMLLGFRGVTVNSIGATAERETATREAVAMARRLQDDGTVMATLTLQRWLLTGVLHPSQTRLIATELVTLSRQAGNDESVLEGLFWRMHDHLELGDVALADRDLAEYTALAERRRHMSHRYWAALFQAMRRTWSGNFAQAAELSESALAWGQRIQEPMAVMFHALVAWNSSIMHDATTDERWDSIAAMFPGADGRLSRAWRLFMHITQRRDQEARRVYEELAQSEFEDIPRDFYRLCVLASLSTACAVLDDRARAPRLYELLLPDAELNILWRPTWLYLGPVSEFLGLLAVCMRDYQRAAEHFEHAIAQCAKFAARPQLARIHYEYAQTLRVTPGAQASHAARLLAEVARTADALGTARSWPLPGAVNIDHEDDS